MSDSSKKQNYMQFPGEICLITQDSELKEVDFSQITSCGFDTETKPAFRKGEKFKTALLQLATDSTAYLVRLHYIKQFNSLREVLENPEVLKVGAAVAHDLKELKNVFHFEPKGFVDVQTIARQKGLKNLGLKKMTEEVFGAMLTKGPKMTNWERQFLTDEQLLYAATDAWISLKLYQELSPAR